MMDTIIGSFTKKDALPTQSIPPLLPRALPSSSTAHNQLRRKTSLVLWFNSSDDPPSPHNSIYDAQYLSANNSEEASNGPESVIPPICKLLSSFPRSKNASSGGEPPVPFHGVSETSGEKYRNTTATEPYTLNTPTTDTPFLYGRGTLLKTITEQSSNATMYSLARRKSVDDLPNLLTQHDDFVLAKGLQRRHSFSLDDLALIEPLHHDGCSVIGGISLEFVPIHEIYAEPKLPLHAPLPRPQTPPGMPSWTQAQNLPVRRHLISQQPNHLQRFFSLSASGLLLSSHMSRTDHLTTGRAVSSPACRRIPRFRPTKSAYAPIDQYPFNRAPLAGMHNPNASPSNLRLTDSYETSAARRFGRRVRFTASATARDSEMDTLQNPMEHTTSIAINSITGVQATRQSQRRPTEPSCPHRKARQAALKTLGSSVNNQPATSPNHDYAVARLPVPPIRQSSSASSARIQHQSLSNLVSGTPRNSVRRVPKRPNSPTLPVSTAAHLMSGALSETVPGQEPKRARCWKCWVELWFEKMDHWWLKGASCLCFVCCGFEIEDDMRLRCGPRSSSGANFCPTSRTPTPDPLGPRRVVLDANPAV